MKPVSERVSDGLGLRLGPVSEIKKGTMHFRVLVEVGSLRSLGAQTCFTIISVSNVQGHDNISQPLLSTFLAITN
jgi:hypothetical protein